MAPDPAVHPYPEARRYAGACLVCSPRWTGPICSRTDGRPPRAGQLSSGSPGQVGRFGEAPSIRVRGNLICSEVANRADHSSVFCGSSPPAGTLLLAKRCSCFVFP